MNAKNITIGTNYNCTLGRNLVEVEILDGDVESGWHGRNLATGKTITIRDAARLSAIPTMPSATKTAKTAAKRATRQPRAKSAAPGERPASLLDAAAIVLQSHPRLKCFQIIDLVVGKGLWEPRTGQTPANTLHAAISREIKEKGDQARFRKVDRGIFALAE